MDDNITISEALVAVYERLSENGIPDARSESEFILMHLFGCKRHELFLNARRPLSPAEKEALEPVIKRRLGREPSQYIFGEAEFRGLTFKVTKDVLIPRPETELLVDEAIKAAGSSPAESVVIDLCTGSGCIAITAAREIEKSRVYATDISGAALSIARENAKRLGAVEKASFFEGDLFYPLPEDLKGRVHLILSNPPYIPENDIKGLEPEVKDFEPTKALDGGPDGLIFIKRIINEAPLWLAPGGWLLMEIGYGQSERVRELTKNSGAYDNIEIIKDYGKIDRILKAGHKS